MHPLGPVTHWLDRPALRLWPLLLLCSLLALRNAAASDVLILKNGDRITGEVKRLNNGNVEIDADYGENIFVIDWSEVENIQSQRRFVAQTSSGQRMSGTLQIESGAPGRIRVEDAGEVAVVDQDQLVYLKQIDEGFWGRFGASLDFGLTVTKADETRQGNARASVSYISENWSADSKISVLRNVRSESDTTKRTDVNANYRRALNRLNQEWFGIGFGSFLQSNELQLDLRSTVGGGLGTYLKRNNRWLLSVMGGAAWTNEQFAPSSDTGETPPSAKNSGEGFGAVELNLFDIGDLDVRSVFTVLPSLTDPGRVRLNFDTDFRWEFIDDFYFSLGFTENFDSAPPGDTPGNDYVFTTSVGWSY